MSKNGNKVCNKKIFENIINIIILICSICLIIFICLDLIGKCQKSTLVNFLLIGIINLSWTLLNWNKYRKCAIFSLCICIFTLISFVIQILFELVL